MRYVFLLCATAMLLVLAARGNAQEPAPLPADELPPQRVSVDGSTMSYVEKGEGAPLVLVHGSPTSSYLWHDMIDALAAGHRVIALDLPGFGHSDPPPNGDYTIAQYARLLAGFLDALSVDSGTLVCHDIGGPITITYALHHPENYDRLIILDTFLHTELPPWPLATRLGRIRPLGEWMMGLWGESIARGSLEAGVVDKTRITDDLVQRFYTPDGTPDKLNTTMLETLRIDWREDMAFIEQNLGTIDKPTLIVWAEKDVYIPPEFGERIHADIPGSRLEHLADCGHFMQLDRPERLTALMLEFLGTETQKRDAKTEQPKPQ